METNIRKENAGISSSEKSEGQFTFSQYTDNTTDIFSEEEIQSQDVIKDIFSSDEENKEIELDILEEELSTGLDDILHTEDIMLPIKPSASKEPLNTQEISMEVEDLQEGGQIKFIMLEDSPTDKVIEEISAINTVPQHQNPFLSSQRTKKAFFVLKDIFGDIETDAEIQAIQDLEVSSRKKLPCILFAFLGGFFGLHRVYLGQYKQCLIYVLICLFGWLSYNILPDIGVSNLVIYVMFFWVTADILAIIFSRKIKDGSGKLLVNWI